MAIGYASNFFNPSYAIPDGEEPAVMRTVFKSTLPVGVDQLAATKSETALMNGRAADAATAPGSRTRSKVNAAPEVSTAPLPITTKNFSDLIQRSQVGAARGQASDIGSAMSTFRRKK